MAEITSKIDYENGYVLTVSDFRKDQYQWQISCAVTGNKMRSGEGYRSIEAATEVMDKHRAELVI